MGLVTRNLYIIDLVVVIHNVQFDYINCVSCRCSHTAALSSMRHFPFLKESWNADD